ncbi:hypothetical protein N9F93_00845 [bacterium]|nr:hypothetical protein [bacterium]
MKRIRFACISLVLASMFVVASVNLLQGTTERERSVGRPDSLPEAPAAPSSATAQIEHTEPVGRGVAMSLLSFSSIELQQEVRVMERPDGQGGSLRDMVSVVEREEDPWISEYVDSAARYVTSGEIRDLDARFYNDLFFAIEDGGQIRIERWLLFDQDGGWTAELPPATSSGSIQTPEAIVFIQGSTNWVAPSQRSGRVPERRLTLQVLPDDGSFRDLAVDPDGRYLVLGVSGSLVQYSVASNSGGQMLSIPAALGFDLSRISSMYFVHTHTFGRVLYCSFEAQVGTDIDDLAIIDYTNDGSFDDYLRVPQSGEFDDGGVVLEDVSRMFNE